MKDSLSRRTFIKSAGAAGTLMLLGGSLLSKIAWSAGPLANSDISVVNGTDYFNNTLKAVDLLGGMKNFVQQGQKVGLLVNSDFEIPGAYVNPDIVLAVIKMCNEAGAREITCIQNIKQAYWERSSYYENFKDDIAKLNIEQANQFPAKFDEKYFIKYNGLRGAKCLTGEVEITKAIVDCDVFINIPIAKHHDLTFYTGAIKNMMGIGTRKTNVFYHLGGPERNDPDFLGQCMADINKFQKSDLIIVDATKFITTGGPVGPGEIKQPEKIVAGTDLVAVDSLCCTYLDYSADDIVSIQKCHEFGLGEIDYSKLNVKEIYA